MRRISVRAPFNVIKIGCVRPPISGSRKQAAEKRRDVRVRDDSEHTLMARIAAGDHAACGQMVNRHLGMIVAYARRLLGDRQEAEDVAQETFVRLWTHAERWQPRNAKVGTWLHRVAHNLCIDRLRKRREILMDELPDRPDPAPPADQQLHQKDVAAVVEAAMAQLPERQRAAILLCHHQELGNIEAAGVLDVSVEALESLLTRGRRKLRELLRTRAPELLGDL